MAAAEHRLAQLEVDIKKLREDATTSVTELRSADEVLTSTTKAEIELVKKFANDLQVQANLQIDELLKQQQTQADMNLNLTELYERTSAQLSTLNGFMNRQDQQGEGGGSKGKGGKGSPWQMTRPKDLLPEVFSGKDEDWPKWKEDIEDYVHSIGVASR